MLRNLLGAAALVLLANAALAEGDGPGPNLVIAIDGVAKGEIVIDLSPDLAPKAVAQLVALAKAGAYDNVVFHRVIEGFMLQGGDPTGTGMGGPGYQFGDEIHPELTFQEPYKLAMANAGPGTNGSQFFITVAPTTWLHGKHTVFGDVVDEDSRKVVDKIGLVATDGRDRPLDDVVIQSITIEKV
jgi:peptidyl-prolyl cis-trans isomerase A (cyclophilin A)